MKYVFANESQCSLQMQQAHTGAMCYVYIYIYVCVAVLLLNTNIMITSSLSEILGTQLQAVIRLILVVFANLILLIRNPRFKLWVKTICWSMEHLCTP